MKWLLVLLARGALAEDRLSTGGKIAGPTTGDAAGGKIAKPSAAMGESLAKQRAAMALEREASQKEAELLSREPLVHHEMEPAEPVCDPIDDAAVNPIIESAAKDNELQPDLRRAVMRQESQFFPCAVSEKGAQGLM